MISLWYSKDVSGVCMVWLRKPTKYRGEWIGTGGTIISEKDFPLGVRPEWTDEEAIEVNYCRV